jgi:hypothetical protein
MTQIDLLAMEKMHAAVCSLRSQIGYEARHYSLSVAGRDVLNELAAKLNSAANGIKAEIANAKA